MSLFADLTDKAMRNDWVPFASIPKRLRAAMLSELPAPKTAVEQRRVTAEVERMYQRLKRKGDLADRMRILEERLRGDKPI